MINIVDGLAKHVLKKEGQRDNLQIKEPIFHAIKRSHDLYTSQSKLVGQVYIKSLTVRMVRFSKESDSKF